MADLEQAATQALDTVREVLRAADEAGDRLAVVREGVMASTARLDADWTRLLDRARDLLDQVAAEERDLSVVRAEATQTLDRLRATEEQLVAESAGEVEETRTGLQAAAEPVEALAPELTHRAEETEQAEQLLLERLETIETELGQAVAEVQAQLVETWVGELRQLEVEVERVTSGMQAWVQSECLPTIAARSQQLFDQLVATEDALRAALESAGETTEVAADQSVQACAHGFEDTLAELRRASTDVEELLDRVGAARRSQADDFQREHDRWADESQAVQRGLRDARDALRRFEEIMSRFSFVHF